MPIWGWILMGLVIVIAMGFLICEWVQMARKNRKLDKLVAELKQGKKK